MKLAGAIKVAFRFSHDQAGALDFGLGGGAFVEQVGVVDGYQQIPFFHFLTGDDTDLSNAPTDFGFHIDLQGGLHLASDIQIGRYIRAARLGQGIVFDFFRCSERRPALIESRGGKDEKKGSCRQEFGHGAGTIHLQGVFSRNTAHAAV